jgi:hypothetical protein
VNPDTGEAETPAHYKALSWRRDLDSKIEHALRAKDRELDIEDKIADMTPEEKDNLLKVYLSQDKGIARQGTFTARPSNEPQSLMGKFLGGEPISRAQARGSRFW